MALSTKRFDYTLRSRKTGDEHGLLIDWAGQEGNPFQLVVKEQEPPQSMNARTDDELYTGRDLTDAWRIFFTKFTAGNGQLDRDVPGGSDAKFNDSYAVDISVPGDLKLQRKLEMIEIGASVLNSLVIEAEGKVVFGCLEGATSRIGWIEDDGSISYATEGAAGDAWPTSSALTSVASDGEYIYAAFTGLVNYGIWRGKTTSDAWSKWSDVSGIEAMQYVGGIMYVVQSGTPGYLSANDNPVFAQLQVARIHKPNLKTFGLTSIGNWAYWGTTSVRMVDGEEQSTGRTYVYALQKNPVTGDRFEHYVELPNGFVGTTMHGYLGNLYIGGFYMTNRGEVGQGAVYMATEQGVARLCNLGLDPNELPVPGPTDPPLPDTYNNRIRVIYGYGAYLYIAGDRAIYRWDIDSGGLAHVVNVSDFSITAGEIIIDPEDPVTWDAAYHLDDFTGWWGSTWGTGGFGTNFKRSESDIIHTGTSDGLIMRVDTGDRYGYNRHGQFSSSPDTAVPAATMRIKTTGLRQEALEFGMCVNELVANLQVYARESDDKWRVGIMQTHLPIYTVEWPVTWQWSGWFDNRNGNHEFWLTHDGTYINLWLRTYNDADELQSTTLVFHNVYACDGTGVTGDQFWWGGGWAWAGETNHPKDWFLWITEIDVDPTKAASVGYVPGAAMIPNMTVVNGVPYAPYVPQSGPNPDGFIALDVTDYADTGWLETSWKSGSMPTVRKHFTALDLFYADLTGGARLKIDIYSDGTGLPGAPSGTLQESIQVPPPHFYDPSLPVDTTIDYVAGSVSCTKTLDFYAHKVKLYITLEGGGSVTPVLHGACLRFGPLASKLYQMMTMFKDNVRDYDNFDYDYLDAYEFIMSAADSGEVLELKAAGLDVLAKVTGIQFLKAKSSRQHSYEPQGSALIQMQRVE